MKVPLLDLSAQIKPMRSEIDEAISKVIDSSVYILGPEVEAFEKNIAHYCGTKHAIGVSSGTDALLAALMSLSIGPGDIVITTPYSFFASAGSIARLNATVAMVEIDPRTYSMDPDALAHWFSANQNRINDVKAIMPVHLFGQCADMAAINDLAAQYGVPVIEDAAQALGATYPSKNGIRKAGTMGKLGCFSFFPSKNLGTMGDGGLIVTDDDDLAEKIRILRVHGSKPKYVHGVIGGNFRLDALHAAVLNVKLPHLETWHAARRANAKFYDSHLQDIGITTPAIQWGAEHHIYNQYVITVPDRRDALRAFLGDQGIQTEVYYPVPLHLQKCFQDLGYAPGEFPHSEYAAAHSLALPIYPELSMEQKSYVVEKIKEYFSN